jgi:hypothetical protein
LVLFHRSNIRFECAYLPEETFQKDVLEDEDQGLTLPSSDFAIYSDRYVFMGESLRAGVRSGIWTHDPSVIQRATDVFDTAWKARKTVHFAHHPHAVPTRPDQLFGLATHAQHQTAGAGPLTAPTGLSAAQVDLAAAALNGSSVTLRTAAKYIYRKLLKGAPD